MERETKIYALKAAITDNTLTGAAAVMGNLDSYDDVIYPGAFSKRGVLKRFLESGFVAVGHDWGALPVAMPTAAKEVGTELQAEATFHSTPEAQAARTVAMERMQAGKSVGLSIGFLPDYKNGCHYFENGSELLAHAKETGCDMSLFDTKSIAACKGYCRGLSAISDLYEFSIVTVPANPKATATDVKAMSLKGFALLRTALRTLSIETPTDLDDAEAVKSVAEYVTSERIAEAVLRDLGFSRKQAVAFVLHGFPGLQRDAAERTEPTPDESAPEPTAAPETPAEAKSAAVPPVVASLPQAADPNTGRFQELTLRLASLRTFAAPEEAQSEHQGTPAGV